jgi:hypothetical protein
MHYRPALKFTFAYILKCATFLSSKFINSRLGVFETELFSSLLYWLHEFSFTKERQQERYYVGAYIETRATNTTLCGQQIQISSRRAQSWSGCAARAHRGFLLSIMRVLLFATRESGAQQRDARNTPACSSID